MARQLSLQKGLIGYWTCDDRDTDSSMIRDRSPYGHHGSFDNNVSTGNSSISGESYYFDGSNPSVDIGHTDDLDPGGDELTMSMWLNLDSYTADNANGSHHFYKKSYGIIGNEPSPFVEIGGSRQHAGGSQIPLNEWKHVVGVFDGQSQEIAKYIDGSLDTTSSTSGTTYDSTTRVLQIGNAGGNNWTTDGNISNVRIYNRILSDSEIRWLYNRRL